MKALINRVWNWFIGLLNKVRRDRLYHFICGLVIAAFFIIVLSMRACIVPVIVAAFAKEFVDRWQDGNFDWIDLLATCVGGAIIQLFVII